MNDAAFERLVRSHVGAVSSYATAICGNQHLADEAVQMTLIRAWKYLDTFDARGSFEGWLLRICRNCVTDLTKSSISAGSVGPDEHQAADYSHELLDLIARLPMPQREVVVLCGLMGYDYESTAQLLELPIGTIRSRLSRGRRSITDMLRSAENEATA